MSKNLATTTVATAPSPATSGTSLTVASGTGGRLYDGLAVLHPANTTPTPANAEVVSITVAGDVVTLTRAQESSTARAVVVGDVITQGITAAMWDTLVASNAAKADAAATTSALAGKANTTHVHSAADVTSGTLPLARGGTGGTDAATARTSLGLGTAAVESPATLASNAAFTATYAPLASPALTGNPTAPTPAPGDNDTSIATTAFVATAVAPKLDSATAATTYALISEPIGTAAAAAAAAAQATANAAEVTIQTALEGRNLIAFGHSYAFGTGASGNNGFVQRLGRRVGFGTTTNLAVGGSVMLDAGTNQTRNLFSAGLIPMRGVVVIDSGYNDGNIGAAGTKAYQSFANNLAALLHIVRSASATLSSVTAGQSSTWTYTGTWSAVADVDGATTIGNSCRQTTTQNDTASVNLFGTDLTILLMGLDDSAFGSAGATVNVTCDGTSVVTGLSLSNQALSAGRRKGYVPVRITGLAPGWHNVVITKTDATGSVLQVHSGWVDSPWKPYVYVLKDSPLINSSMSTVGAAIDAVCAAFTDGRVTAVASPASWTSGNIQTKVAVDSIHPNDVGHEDILLNLYDLLKTVPNVTGVSNPSVADANPVVTPVSVTDDFNRADSANLGATSVGAVPWRHGTPGSRWGVVGNAAGPLVSTANSGVVVETGRSDCTVTATVVTKGGNGCGLRFRYVDESNYYVWFGDGNLYKNPGGGFTNIGTPGNFVDGDTLQAVLSGTSITLRKNGTTVLTITDSSYNGTKHGLHASNLTTTRFDNFSVAP